MSQWKNVDEANSAPNWSAAAAKLAPTANNVARLYNNQTANNDILEGKQVVGVFAMDATEVANTASASGQGWTVRRVGTGGRAGRITHETVVALSNVVAPSGD